MRAPGAAQGAAICVFERSQSGACRPQQEYFKTRPPQSCESGVIAPPATRTLGGTTGQGTYSWARDNQTKSDMPSARRHTAANKSGRPLSRSPGVFFGSFGRKLKPPGPSKELHMDAEGRREGRATSACEAPRGCHVPGGGGTMQSWPGGSAISGARGTTRGPVRGTAGPHLEHRGSGSSILVPQWPSRQGGPVFRAQKRSTRGHRLAISR